MSSDTFDPTHAEGSWSFLLFKDSVSGIFSGTQKEILSQLSRKPSRSAQIYMEDALRRVVLTARFSIII